MPKGSTKPLKTTSEAPLRGAAPDLLTLQQVADILRTSKSSVRRLVNSGTFRSLRAKEKFGIIRVYRDSVLAWIESNTYGGAPR